MNGIKSLSPAEKTNYLIKIYSDRLLKLTKLCPDDGALMNATGFMYYRKKIKNSWVVEYKCPKDSEIVRSWTPEVNELTQQIAKDILGEANIDESS